MVPILVPVSIDLAALGHFLGKLLLSPGLTKATQREIVIAGGPAPLAAHLSIVSVRADHHLGQRCLAESAPANEIILGSWRESSTIAGPASAIETYRPSVISASDPQAACQGR